MLEQDDPVVETKRPNIQEVIQSQSRSKKQVIEEIINKFYDDPKNFSLTSFNFYDILVKAGVNQAHARYIRQDYQEFLDEVQSINKKPDSNASEDDLDFHQQLLEAYEDLTKQDIELLKELLTSCVKACDLIIDTAKANRKRTKQDIELLKELLTSCVKACDLIIDTAKANRKRPKKRHRPKERIVAKLKYKINDDKYHVVSVNPTEIIGASYLWVFNVNTRKIGRYVAKTLDPQGMGRDGTGLQVKGTSIIGYNEETSLQKTLRQPEAQLEEFKNCGKIKIKTFLEDIKTTETKLNGRINPDTILLKTLA